MAKWKPRSGEQWHGLSESYRKRLERAGISETDYRSGKSLSIARGHGGYKTMKVIVREGGRSVVREVEMSGRERSRIASHWNYVKAGIHGHKGDDYLEDKLSQFEGMRVGRGQYEVETDLRGIHDLAFHGELDFESTYPDSE